LRAILLGDLACGYRTQIEAALHTGWDLVSVPDGTAGPERNAALGRADAVVAVRWTGSDPVPAGLRLLQVAAAGYDAVIVDAVPPEVAICNAFGHEPAIGEYAVMTMLAWCHGFLPAAAELRAGRWQMDMQARPPHRELAGSHVLVVGTGRIGRAIGARAAVLGCHVSGINRTVREPPPGFASLDGLAALDRLLPGADFLVLACPLSDETRGLIDARRLALLPPRAVILNVARGAVIAEDALYESLAARRIAGAILDVWWTYPSADDPQPAPSRQPFHELENVIMTPHYSGWTDGLFRRRSADIAANLDRLCRGEPLINVVRPAAAGT
jgi:phosphoglycerate dehydrogenase-like enzyme